MLTKLFVVNAIGDPEPIVVGSACSLVTIREDASVPNWPTIAYSVRAPYPTSDPVRREAGEPFTFTFRAGWNIKANKNQWDAGDIIGYVETAAGSTTFSQVEE